MNSTAPASENARVASTCSGSGDQVRRILDRLREDYRLAIIGHLATPVWQQSFGLPPAIWWPHLHRILAAFEDLDCAALLS